MKRAPSTINATLTMARLTALRMMRDRGTLLLAALVLIPVAFVGILGSNWSPDNGWSRVINVAFVPLFAIVVPMALAPLIAEEASEQTYSYLWSRPIPRGAVLAGKALALAPLVLVLFSISATLCWLIVFGTTEPDRLAKILLAVFAGTVAAGTVSAALGVFLHKHAVAAGIAYLLVVDLFIGVMPFSLAKISITHHLREIAGTGDLAPTIVTSLLWCAGYAIVASALMSWRLRRVELSAST